MIHKIKVYAAFIGCLILVMIPYGSKADPQDSAMVFDLKVRQMAFECRDEVKDLFDGYLESKHLTLARLFDTFYIPIQNTRPPKFHTSYDKIIEGDLRFILDGTLKLDPKILYVVAVDRNGYVPTHNSKYSKPLTDDPGYNAKHNRTKQIYNDRTGLAAARNTKAFLVQSYNRDTGEETHDISVPIFIKNKHWGAVRVGYTQ